MPGDELPDAQAESWVVAVVGCVLVRLIEANADLQHSGSVTKFHALRPPAIKVVDYLERIQKYSSASSESFILALIYIDRLIRSNNFALTLLNAHRVIITSIMVAAKFFDDQYYNNAFYAKVGGVPSLELNSLEIELLFRVNFTLHVTADEFYKYKAQLYNHAAAGLCSCRISVPTQPVILSQQQAAAADYMRQPPRPSGLGGSGAAEHRYNSGAAEHWYGSGEAERRYDSGAAENRYNSGEAEHRYNSGKAEQYQRGWHERDRPYAQQPQQQQSAGAGSGGGGGASRQGASSSNFPAANGVADQYHAEHHRRGYGGPGRTDAPGWWPEQQQATQQLYGNGVKSGGAAAVPLRQGQAYAAKGSGASSCGCGQCERCYDSVANGGYDSAASGGGGSGYGGYGGSGGAYGGTAYGGGGSNAAAAAAAAAAHGCSASSQHYGEGRPRLSDRTQLQPW